MKHKINFKNSNSSEYFEQDKEFKSVKLKNIIYSNHEDAPNIISNWIHGPFGAIFAIPISQSVSGLQKNFDLIKMAENFDEPFTDRSINWISKLIMNLKINHLKLHLKSN